MIYPAAIVYVGKVLETQMRTMNEILDRTADLHFEDDQHPCSSVADCEKVNIDLAILVQPLILPLIGFRAGGGFFYFEPV